MRSVEILSFFLQTGWIAKIVLVTLLLFSLASWSVILAKWRELSAARRGSERFLRVFRKASRLSEAAEAAPQHRSSPLAAMFLAGYTELEAGIRATRRAGAPDSELKLRSLDGVSRALERAVGSEVERLQRALPLLATTASVTPFIGLFWHGLGHHEHLSRDRRDRLDLDRHGGAGHRRGARQHRRRLARRDPGRHRLQPPAGRRPTFAAAHGRPLRSSS